ncbi:unknown [Prevotella sp. CAG:592]|nr:unknown [Prevotella sp. CAG:592]
MRSQFPCLGLLLVFLSAFTKIACCTSFMSDANSPTWYVCPPAVYSYATASTWSVCSEDLSDTYPRAWLTEYSEELSRRALCSFS